jgi:serine/threonine protein kinase
MILPDATLFLKLQKQVQADPSLSQQEWSRYIAGEQSSLFEAPIPRPSSQSGSRGLCMQCHLPVQIDAVFCAHCGFPSTLSFAAHVKSQTFSPGDSSREELMLTPSASAPVHEGMLEEDPEQAREGAKSSHRAGQRLGSYQLIRLLGEGGFAEVYLGEHIHLGSLAAVKVLHSQLTHEDIDTFRSEARTLVRLIHPHIIRVLDFGIEGKTPFLVMDYALHGTLRQLHPKGRSLSFPTIVSYVKQAAEALQFAHDAKIIHRDIKPENMLLGRHNELLLSDFGIALVAQSSRYQSTKDMAGTMAYMAPEQIQAHPQPASDQYSLGIVVYEWLCGDRPFRGTFAEIAAKQMLTPPSSLCDRLPTLPAAVEEVVFKALAKDPKSRFESVSAFAIALELVGESVSPPQPHEE